MKRIIASTGLLALGIAGTQAASVAVTAPMDKPWSLSARLRGFYDDNISLSSDNEKSSFGLEASPSVGVNLHGEQTTFGANYTYTLRYFFDRADECVDHSHQFNTWLMHAFSQRYSIDMHDSLVYSQEPNLTIPLGGTLRNSGNTLINDGQVNFHAQVTRLLEIVVGYRNAF